MHNFKKPNHDSLEANYKTLVTQINHLIEEENDITAILSNISSTLKETFNFLWVGFYLIKNEELADEKYELKPMGSSLKVCLVADGSVHLYPRLGPTMEWDTAASHAIIRAAGGELIKVGTNEPLEYNKQDLLNPEFIAGHLDAIRSLERVN